jgi:hypothetical protein
MGCRGVYFALTDDEAQKLLNAKGDAAVLAIINEEIMQRWDEPWLQTTDKAWDGMHRCLGDGTLYCKGTSILEKCVLGGRQLHRTNRYTVSFLSPEEVVEVAKALEPVDKSWIRQRFFGLKKKFLWFDISSYSPIDEQEFEYIWEYMDFTKEFYKKAVEAKRAIVFIVDH